MISNIKSCISYIFQYQIRTSKNIIKKLAGTQKFQIKYKNSFVKQKGKNDTIKHFSGILGKENNNRVFFCYRSIYSGGVWFFLK